MTNSEFNSIVAHAIKHGAQVKPPFLVSTEAQEKRLEVLRQTVPSCHFFFVVNLKDFSLEHVIGVNNWLGYHNFDMRKYMMVTDYEHHPILKHSGQVIIEDITEGRWRINFAEHKFMAKQTFQHANGSLISTLRVSSAWQYNDKNQVIAYLNEFTVIGSDSLPTDPTTSNNAGIAYEYQIDILKRARERAWHELIDEKQVLTYRDVYGVLIPIAEGKSTEEVAKLLTTAKHTMTEDRVRYIRREILAKVKTYFDKPFDGGIAEVLTFFRAEGLLERKRQIEKSGFS
jgi:hypothetical protein